MTVIHRRLGISEQGNVIEIVTRYGAPQLRTLVHKTHGIDRRARKRQAQTWIAEHDTTRVYGTITWHHSAPGAIVKMAPITITIVTADPA